LDIEREILGLPYISEVMTVGVSDVEFGQRVGAVVSLRQDRIQCLEDRQLTLDRLRKDLRGKLAGYKMPTLLRVVEGELPKTASGKVLKKILGPKYFPEGHEADPDVQAWKGSNNTKDSGVMAKL